jgi:hypothetical protein
MERLRPVAVASAALLAHAACASTSYTPRPDGRIASTLEDGRPMLVKDGRALAAGGAALKEFTAGNPAAEEHTRSYIVGMRLGIIEQLVGLGALIAGGVVVAPKQDEMGMSLPVSSERQTAGTVLLIGGLTAFIISGFQLASAQAHYQDAINVYNDGVPPRFLPPPPWQPTSPVPLSPQPPPPTYPPPPQPPPPPPAATPPPPTATPPPPAAN